MGAPTKNPLVEQAEQRIRNYEAEIDRWQADHVEAMACLTFENTLRLGISLYDFLLRVDEELRILSVQCDQPDLASVQQCSERLFRWWLQPCARVEAELARFLGKGYDILDAEEFRRMHGEARRMLEAGPERYAAVSLGIEAFDQQLVDAASMQRAGADVAAGRTVPLEELAVELEDRVRSRGRGKS